MLTVGVLFGGVSPEHEVSVITALQAAAALDRSRYRPVALYLAKSGQWYTGPHLLDIGQYRDLDALLKTATPVALVPTVGQGVAVREVRDAAAGLGRLFEKPLWEDRLDVLLLGLHGGAGEGGGIQGLAEAYGVPYTGSGILGSALGMDKVLTKMLCRDQGIPVVEWVALRESAWAGHEDAWLDRMAATLGFPVIVKPARLGSSIGIAKADDRDALDAALEDAFRYDEKVVVEAAVPHLFEINCSVLGDVFEAAASVLEQPVQRAEAALLTFAEKYQRGGGAAKGAKAAPAASEGMASLDRLIPAPIPEAMAAQIRDLAVRVFQLFECAGIARIDFLVNGETGQVYFNEINTIPGSFSFYLWEPSGIPFDQLMHRLIEGALVRARRNAGRVVSFETNLLAERSQAGAKRKKV